MHVTKLDYSVSSRQLKQQSWTQQHEQHHCYHNRPPIRHGNCSLLILHQLTAILVSLTLLKGHLGRKTMSFYTRKESYLMGVAGGVSVNNKKSCSTLTLHRNRYSSLATHAMGNVVTWQHLLLIFANCFAIYTKLYYCYYYINHPIKRRNLFNT